jgi:predicted Zn-dependent protease
MAHLTLEQIEPSVSRPASGPNIPPLSDRAQQQILKARSLLADQRFTEAAIELERALRSDPNHPAVHAVLAVLHLQAGNLDRARSHATRSLESNSDSAAVHYVLGRCKMKAGEAAGALYELRTATVCSDFQQDLELAALCRYHLAELLAGEGYNTAALSQYDEFEKTAAQLRDDAAGHAFSTELSGILGSPALLAESRARLLAGLGRHEEAAQILAPVVASRPGDTALAVQHAELLMNAGRLDEAFQAVQKIAANDEAVITLIHDICRKAGDPQRAVSALKERLAASPDDAGLVLRFAETLERQGALDQAGAALEGFLRDHASASAVRTRLIELRVKQNDWPAAVGLAADAIGVSPASAGPIAGTLLSAASQPGGIEAMLAVAERGDRCSDSYLAGVLAAKTGNTDRAVEHLKRAIETAADFAAARVALGQIYFDQYRYDDALKTIPADQSPTVADAQLLLARVYDRLDDLSRADQHYRAAIQLDRNNQDSKFALAELYFRGGETEQAQRQANLLLQQNPDHERARELLGMIYWNEKKADLFIGEFRELGKRTTRATTAARCRIMTDETLRANPPEARKILLAALEEGEPDARTWLAVVATYEPDELAEQRQGYVNALALEPDNEDALLGLSRVDQLDLRFESAVTRLEDLVRRRPNRHDWRQRLIELKLVLQSFDNALELARPQLEREELDPRERNEYRGLYLKALAWARRTDELEAQLRQWMEADPAERQWSARLVEHRLAKKDFAGAIDICERLHKDNEEDPLTRAWLITVMIAGKEYTAATQHCLDWLRQRPDDDPSTRLLATVLAESGEVDAALDLVRSRMVRTSDRETYQNWMLDHLSRADRHEEAVELAQILLDTSVQALREAADRGPAALNEPQEKSE